MLMLLVLSVQNANICAGAASDVLICSSVDLRSLVQQKLSDVTVFDFF